MAASHGDRPTIGIDLGTMSVCSCGDLGGGLREHEIDALAGGLAQATAKPFGVRRGHDRQLALGAQRRLVQRQDAIAVECQVLDRGMDLVTAPVAAQCVGTFSTNAVAFGMASVLLLLRSLFLPIAVGMIGVGLKLWLACVCMIEGDGEVTSVVGAAAVQDIDGMRKNKILITEQELNKGNKNPL